MTEYDIEIGRFRIRAAYRYVGGDEGITIHIFGPVRLALEEVLRFDCFRKRPHYHLGWSYRHEPFKPIAASAPLTWTLDQLADHANEFLAEAGADQMIDEELSMLPQAISRLRALGEELTGGALLGSPCPLSTRGSCGTI